MTRRQFFGRNAVGLGSAALATLLGRELPAADAKKQVGGLPGLPHFPPQAKHVIYLLQNGAPPHVDTFDYKPGMEKFRGQELPESFHKNQRLSTMTAGQKQKLVLPPFTGFKQYGDCGAWVCDFLPHMAVCDGVRTQGIPASRETLDLGVKRLQPKNAIGFVSLTCTGTWLEIGEP